MIELAFENALKQLSYSRLRRYAVDLKKDIEQLKTKQDFVSLLTSTTTKGQKLDALRSFLLAGRGSLALYQLAHKPKVSKLPPFERASRTPSVVLAGRKGAIIDGQNHLSWAVLDEGNTYLDADLQLQVEPVARIIESFYDPEVKTLQVRADAHLSRRIAMQFAEFVALDPRKDVSLVGLDDLDQLHKFTKKLNGKIVKCHGKKKVSKGFLKVWGEKHPNHADLLGTTDYNDFTKETDPLGRDVSFDYDNMNMRIHVALTTKSISFVTAATEPAIQFVYQTLKEHLGL
jgi:hypothetical protein